MYVLDDTLDIDEVEMEDVSCGGVELVVNENANFKLGNGGDGVNAAAAASADKILDSGVSNANTLLENIKTANISFQVKYMNVILFSRWETEAISV